jgi:hypothetical protein
MIHLLTNPRIRAPGGAVCARASVKLRRKLLHLKRGRPLHSAGGWDSALGILAGAIRLHRAERE